MPANRDQEPAASIHDKFVAFQRRNAAATRPRERSERPIPSNKRRAPSPSPVASSSNHSPAPRPNPDRDRTEPDATTPRPHGRLLSVPNGTLASRKAPPPLLSDEPDEIPHHPRQHTSREHPAGQQRQLFDPRKDDPVRFQTSAFSRPAPVSKGSVDTFVSASSTSASSYAHSIGSSFTLTSNSTGTSGSSSGSPNAPREEGEGGNAFVFQLKKLYREITALEGRLIAEELETDEDDEPRFTLQARTAAIEPGGSDDRYAKMISDHKSLADMMQRLMSMTLSPQVPTSVHSISSKYNIPTRLWGNAFHHALQTLRKASAASNTALEHLNDFIFWAYSFYTSLVEDPQVESFRGSWLEALGDLARYRRAVTSFNPSPNPFSKDLQLSLPDTDDADDADGSANPSVGARAAQALEVEPESEQWRQTARRWYAQGLQDTPGTGKLHHHLGLLSRDVKDEELRAVYHFTKSLTVTHPFSTSRETVLSLFSLESQRRRALADASSKDLFILLHGMLFTHIELDEFAPTVERFLERLNLDNAYHENTHPDSSFWEERDWIIMGVVNIASILEYGKAGGRVKNAMNTNPTSTSTGDERREPDVGLLVQRSQGLTVDDHEPQPMDIDGVASWNRGTDGAIGNRPLGEDDEPLTFQMALKLTFNVFSHAIRQPFRKATPFARPALNPYIDIILTFLAASLRRTRTVELMERSIPWQAFADFLNTAPHQLHASEIEGGFRITQGCLPLPEDWCVRGMEWAARRTYERGFWKADAGLGGEQAVLNSEEVIGNATDGIIEDDDDEEPNLQRKERGENTKRWVRILRASVAISRAVDGFSWNKESRIWIISGQLATKVAAWAEEERMRALEDLRRRERHWYREEDYPDVGEEVDEDDESEEDPEDTEEVKALKTRRRYLQSLLKESNVSRPLTDKPKPRTGHSKHGKFGRMPLQVIAGYTVLVVDTNILLSSFTEFSALVESCRWTVIVPLVVITELDGISSNQNELGAVASCAVSFISKQVRSHNISLKVQTSKGNYLSTLNVRSEEFQFTSGEGSWEQNMDDLIIRAAVWQKDHWVDRSRLLSRSSPTEGDPSVSKVVLLSFDRNLRLKSRAREVDAADEQQLAQILATSYNDESE